VQEYIDQFSELVDQLLAYEHSASDNRYYTARFVDGLKDDIKFLILVQRPCNLDTACCLALLQEEADMARHRDLRKIDYNFRPKPSAPARPLPLPQPPSSANKPTLGAPTSTNVTRSAPDSQSMNKVVALTAYRMARGLCRYCAEKWVKGHKCAATVPLHAVQDSGRCCRPIQEVIEVQTKLGQWIKCSCCCLKKLLLQSDQPRLSHFKEPFKAKLLSYWSTQVVPTHF
jgi:hypothetical protein